MIFRSREEAARLLARRLGAYYRNKHPLVFGIPRGAVPMAKIIADTLGGELDVLLVPNPHHPSQPAMANGATDASSKVSY